MAGSPSRQVVTIFVNGGSVRLSRVSEHGEELITDPEPEIACLAAFIYKHLAEGGSMTGIEISASLSEAARALEHAQANLSGPLEAMRGMASALGAMNRRLDALEGMLNNRVLTIEETKKWIGEVLKPAVTKQPKGQ